MEKEAVVMPSRSIWVRLMVLYHISMRPPMLTFKTPGKLNRLLNRFMPPPGEVSVSAIGPVETNMELTMEMWIAELISVAPMFVNMQFTRETFPVPLQARTLVGPA